MMLQQAENHCLKTGARFTAPRRAVLEIVARAEQPIGAYDILKRLSVDAKPPTVYRALEFWEQEGFIHRISSLNLYTICRAGHRHKGAQFLICNDCGDITETHICHLPESCSAPAQAQNFEIQGWFLELRGLCQSCKKKSGAGRSALCA